MTPSRKEQERVHFLLTLLKADRPLTARELADKANIEAALEMFSDLPLVGVQALTTKLNAMRKLGLVSSIREGYNQPVVWEPTPSGVALAKEFEALHGELA